MRDKNLNLNKRDRMYTLEQCLEQQKKVDASIKHNGTYLPWLAGIGEVIEMCEHLSLISTWKKQPEPDMKQAFMELVDVFAFALSDHFDVWVSKPLFVNDKELKFVDNTLDSLVSRLVIELAKNDTSMVFHIIFAVARTVFKRPVTDVYYYYMGKQTLTRFRQANGYKDGSYIKMWGGREDNEYLTDALESGVEIDELFNHLNSVYNRVVIAKSEIE